MRAARSLGNRQTARPVAEDRDIPMPGRCTFGRDGVPAVRTRVTFPVAGRA